MIQGPSRNDAASDTARWPQIWQAGCTGTSRSPSPLSLALASVTTPRPGSITNVAWWAVSIDVEHSGAGLKPIPAGDGRVRNARFTWTGLPDGRHLVGLRLSVDAPDQESAIETALACLAVAAPNAGTVERKVASIEGDLNVAERGGPPGSGVREPRRPSPSDRPGAAMVDGPGPI